VGFSGQKQGERAALDKRVRDSGRYFCVIPILLPGAKRNERSRLPTFLAATTWVEFRDSLEDPDAFLRNVLDCQAKILEAVMDRRQCRTSTISVIPILRQKKRRFR
jgi:hypothetical protein